MNAPATPVTPKYAAYICSGCGIGDAMKVGQLENIAKKEGKMALVKSHPFLCNAEGVQTIRDDIANEQVTHVCIAACSRRAKTEAFQFDGVALSRANLREGVLWVVAAGKEHDEVRQEMAADYVRMGCAEVKKMKQPAGKAKESSSKRILVVGGGMSGMTAALEIADAGYEAVIVEKTGALGGMAAKLWKRQPFKTPYSAAQEVGAGETAAKVAANPLIKVHLNSTIAETSGAPGRFTIKVAQESGTVTEETVGAIVQATGFTTYDLAKLPELGGGQPNVVDQAGLEALAKQANGGAIKRADGKDVKSVVFVQCAGQRDTTGQHLSYCSGHCCGTSIKQAMYFKDQNPDVDTVVMYQDLRVPGMGEDFYRSAQERGVIFTKGKASKVAGGDSCAVTFKDLILDEENTIAADLVVLATGQVPNAGVDLEAWNPVVTAAEGGDEAAKAQRIVMHDSSVLKLNYRQGPDVPQFKHGFADSHFICFPYETRRTGIYAAGPVRRPMDMLQATDDATGAALKAIQAVENAALGPRRPPAFGRPVLPHRPPRRLHPVQALHRRMPLRRHRRGRKALPRFQRGTLPPLRHLHGRLPGARDLLRELLGRHRRQPGQGGRGSRGRRGKAAHPGAGLRERRLPGARHGGHGAHELLGLGARHPGALPRFGEHHLDHRRAERRLRRRDDDGLQEGRRLPVPLRQGLGTRPLPHEQDR
jgi:quinone-modifying oxidoreductase subunit QmoB